jgi:hypothetical protein
MKHQVPIDSDIAVASLTRALEARGLRVYLSFNLRSAVAAIHDCACPHHGTDQCTCQYAVLLVYRKTHPPAQVVVHGCDGKTWFSLPTSDNAAAALQRFILEILGDTFVFESSQQNHLGGEESPSTASA